MLEVKGRVHTGCIWVGFLAHKSVSMNAILGLVDANTRTGVETPSKNAGKQKLALKGLRLFVFDYIKSIYC